MECSSKTSLKDLFSEHLRVLLSRAKGLLDGEKGLIIDSGVPYEYFKDDQTAPFRSNPYFKYFCPLEGEKHLFCLSPEGKAELFVFEPKSFWSDISYDVDNSFWHHGFEISYIRSDKERQDLLHKKQGWAFIGRPFDSLKGFEFKLNPELFLSALNWWRAEKSNYEIFCLKKANERASFAHKVVRKSFLTGKANEISLHQDYLKTLGDTEEFLPYHSIIANNEKAAILHYQHKRKEAKSDVLLIDAGASFLSYGSDITRTHLREESCHPAFNSLYRGVEALQKKICLGAREGVSFVDLQLEMHLGLSEILMQEKVLHVESSEKSLELGLSACFCPHGLGHMLGIQVHDVGGDQIDIKGSPCTADPRLPKARMSRALRENEVVTVEPGLYFIPYLLGEKKGTKLDEFFNWSLIEELVPFGGIRIEDNLVIQKEAEPLNLTRAYLP